MTHKAENKLIDNKQCGILRIKKPLLLLSFLVMSLAVGIFSVKAQETIEIPQKIMELGQADYVYTQTNCPCEITKVTSGNPSVATARIYESNSIQVVAKGLGETTIEFWDNATRILYKIKIWVVKPGSNSERGGGNNAGSPKKKDDKKGDDKKDDDKKDDDKKKDKKNEEKKDDEENANTNVVLPPMTIVVGNAAYAKTRARGQSAIKNVVSSDRNIAWAREWGTNDVQINAKTPGTTTISFFDETTGTSYQVTVTVIAKANNPVIVPPVKKKDDAVVPPDEKKNDAKKKDDDTIKPKPSPTPTSNKTTTGLVDPCSGTGARQRVALAQARERINSHIASIEERKKSMTETYYYTGAAKTLENAFKESGITASMDNADSWGKMGIGLTWSQTAKQFYDYHLDILNQLLRVIERRGYATQSEMAYLDSGMQSWDESDRSLEKQFQAFVKVFTQEAKVYDEKAAYLKQYYAKLARLQSKRPYPSDEIYALNNNMYRDTKAFDDRIKQIESEDLQKVKDNIADTASKQLFKLPNC